MRKETKYTGYTCDTLGNFYNRHGKEIKTAKTGKEVVFIINGKRAYRQAAKVIWETFNGDVPKGYIVVKMFDKTNSLHNLKLMTRAERNKKFKYTRKAVGLYKNGRLVETYKSVSECARKNFLDDKTVRGICNNVIKRKAADFRWER